ncbi:MAG: CDP-glycerol glycerophosphotransferase family protein, partial [Eubacterium sp.]|nr:CDP-glycerol glycerophosphotransferase family protein [Eubacterium sp.]
YEHLKKEKGIPFHFWLHPEEIRDAGIPMLLDMARKLGKSKVVVTDDYVPYFQELQLNRKTKLVQLWHACGAFKTFGFSRTGKPAGPRQNSNQHRNYDYAFVFSKYIAKYYAEGFGLAQEKIVPYGVPRTDIFWDEKVKEKIRAGLYDSYPELKGKKVILFAPTFRGNGKNSAFYEKKRFDPNRFIKALPEDYILLIKHHPFVKLEYKIKEANASRVFDFSDKSEINHLLFITDVMITDYSSVVYEASILDIPMLLYAYDLENYISSRDFYTEYKNFVPGKIVRTQEELVESILNHDYHQELVKAFCQKNFDIQDGQASRRVADFILKIAAE